MRNALFAALLLCSLSINRGHSGVINQINYTNLRSALDSSRYVTFAFNYERDEEHFDKGARSTNLTSDDITKINNLIDKATIAHNKITSEDFHINNPRKYYKQLVAVINAKGEKEVWVNCFCSINDKSSWKKAVMIVMDGGNCYFNLKINLTRNTVSDFLVNGNA